MEKRIIEPSLNQIREHALALGFHKVGIAALKEYDDQAEEHLQAWLNKGYQADMDWMKNPRRKEIQACFPQVQSVISVALNYYTPNQRTEGQEYGKISRYGWGRDYHKVMDKKLKTFSRWLEAQGEGIETKYYADTGPVPDKVWAQRAGIGWIAKNGNLITREYGSWVFLGEVLTNIPLEIDEADTPHTEHCGSCTRCIEACPTNAIAPAFVVNANRCIAYHTIENREPDLPADIKPHLQNWVAGCDICQDVCPWNQRFAQPTDVEDFAPYPENIAPKLQDLATISPSAWDNRFRASALRRIKPEMLRRNARANLANSAEAEK